MDENKMNTNKRRLKGKYLVASFILVYLLIFFAMTFNKLTSTKATAINVNNITQPLKSNNPASDYSAKDILSSKIVLNTKQIENPSNSDEKICTTKDVLHEIVKDVDPNDDIQEIIGYQNNKVGLYIYSEVEDYNEFASEMANSNGGAWGYVLVPYNVKDYDENRWGRLFDQLSERKLIPIVQLWDLDLEDTNDRDKQIQKSAEFLNSLKWPIKHRYVSVYNEPNDKKFWKNRLNPAEYAEVLEKTINAFESLNPNFFMMNGAFNTSARTGGDYLDAETYMIRMNDQVPGIFKRLEGWASHPYPQPNFSGSPRDRGRDSIRAYEWELNILKNRFGVDISKLPVFITETGWAHKEGEELNNGNRVPYRLDQYQVADNFRYAFENVWLPDDRVVAITPFTVRYKEPFDHFSWITKDGNPYPQFNAIKDIEKVEGKPPTVEYYKSKIIECEN